MCIGDAGYAYLGDGYSTGGLLDPLWIVGFAGVGWTALAPAGWRGRLGWISERTRALAPSGALILLMVIAGLQTSINYGVMGFTPSFLGREYGLSLAETGLQFGLLSAALGIGGPLVAGPLSDWLTKRMGGKGMVWAQGWRPI
mgnify:CR=1 FL=1